MIFLGLDPGTSDNMALAALWPECPDPQSRLRVELVAESEGADARARALGAFRATLASFKKLGLPREEMCVLGLEWQRPLPTDKRPVNISDLSAFAGIGLAAMQSTWQVVDVYTPLPEQWKGSIPKYVKHNRIVGAAGVSAVVSALTRAGIPVPKNLGKFTREFTGKAGNALDAIGLAYYSSAHYALRETVRKATLPPS